MTVFVRLVILFAAFMAACKCPALTISADMSPPAKAPDMALACLPTGAQCGDSDRCCDGAISEGAIGKELDTSCLIVSAGRLCCTRYRTPDGCPAGQSRTCANCGDGVNMHCDACRVDAPPTGKACLGQPCSATNPCMPELYCNPIGQCAPIRCSSTNNPCTALGMTCDLNHVCTAQKGQRCDSCSRSCNTITGACSNGICE